MRCKVLDHLRTGLASNASRMKGVHVTGNSGKNVTFDEDVEDPVQYRFPDFGYVDHLNFCRENRNIWRILYEHISDLEKNKNERIKNIIEHFRQ